MHALRPISGSGGPMIAVRVGRIVIVIADRRALNSMLEAAQAAEDLAEQAFGP